MDRIRKSWRAPLLFLLLGAGSLALLCAAAQLFLRSSSLPLLPAARGAEWVLYPKPLEGTRHRAVPLTATFQRSFVLAASPAQAVLTLRAFSEAAVTLNGHPACATASPASNWKSPLTADVTRLLRPGTNVLTVSVTNSAGPPALWLHLQAGPLAVATGEDWQATLAGSDWQPARLATRPPASGPDNPLSDSESTLDSLKRAWPFLAAFAALSLLLLKLFGAIINGQSSILNLKLAPSSWPWLLLTVIMVARAALFLHNAPLLPRSTGFDAEAHEDYVQFILQHHALPLPADGWEMYQPPLYYTAGALLLGAGGYSLADDDATLLLRGINGVAGLIHCWLALLCLRLLFPGNASAQAAGLLLAAFIPPHLYLSQAVTNEPLAGLFVTVALYFYLRLWSRRREEASRMSALRRSGSLWLHIGLGAALGAAMLTKVSALIPVVVFLAALIIQSRMREAGAQRTGAGPSTLNPQLSTLHQLLAVLLPILLICGWHYGRAWAHTGRSLVGTWDASSSLAWWQDPGFHTGAFYTSFGQALVRPLFSAVHSFADGFYSTLWGDGLASGAARLVARPPWNYDLMNAAALLSLGLCLIFLAGLALAVVRVNCQLRIFNAHSSIPPAQFPGPWSVICSLVLIIALAVLYISLRVPSYALVKAFYAFPALVPFAALFALGWGRVSGIKCHASRPWHLIPDTWNLTLGIWLLTWSLTTYSAFWIRPANPQTHLLCGLYLADHQRDPEALTALSQALEYDAEAPGSGGQPLLASSRAEAHFQFGGILERQGRPSEAVGHYRESLRVRPNSPGALNNLAWLLATSPNDPLRNGPEAVRLAERACALTHHEIIVYLGTLAAAYAEAGRFPESVAMAEQARDRARAGQQEDLARRNQELLQLYREGKPYREAKQN